MIVRACLCALDWNFNAARPQKVDETGKPSYREKVRTCIFFTTELYDIDFKLHKTQIVILIKSIACDTFESSLI